MPTKIHALVALKMARMDLAQVPMPTSVCMHAACLRCRWNTWRLSVVARVGIRLWESFLVGCWGSQAGFTERFPQQEHVTHARRMNNSCAKGSVCLFEPSPRKISPLILCPPLDAKARQAIGFHPHRLRLCSPMFGEVHLGDGFRCDSCCNRLGEGYLGFYPFYQWTWGIVPKFVPLRAWEVWKYSYPSRPRSVQTTA